MTRRLGGIGSRSLAALATASLAAALACGMTIGCGGDSGGGTPATNEDGGDGSITMMPEGGDTSTTPDTGGKPDMGAPETGQTPDGGDGGPLPPPACPTPTITPNGGNATAGQNITIAATNPPAGGEILYTLTGNPPTRTGANTLTLPGTGGMPQLPTTPGTVTVDAVSISTATPPACTDSVVVTATFTIPTMEAGAPDAGQKPTTPAFNPTTTTQNNDFSVALSANGATICYTTDGVTMPGCNNGTCAAGSTTYNGTGVTVSPTITNATTGKVTINALSCNAAGNSAPASQAYTLQVAAPAMLMPDSAKAIAYTNNAGTNSTSATPTVSDLTIGASARFFTGTNMPDCATGLGTALTLPYLLGSSNTLGPITHNTLFQMVGCKTGYAPSAVTPIQYWVQLNQPTFAVPGGATYDTATKTNVVSDTANAGSADWLCWTSDNSPPTCSATSMACTAGTSSATQAPQVTATGQQLNVVACSGSNGTTNSGFQSSVVPNSSGVYTLQLDPIDFNKPGAGVASYTFVTADGASKSVTIEQNGTGDAPSYVCVGLNTGTVDCTCNAVAGHGFQHAIGDTVTVHPNDIWIGYACSATTTTIGNSVVAQASYQPIGAAAAPSIGPAAGNYMTQQTITLTNNGTGAIAQFLCATTNGTTPVPAAGCTSNVATSTECSGSAVAAGTGTYALLAKVENNNTTVEAVGCNATQSTSSAATQSAYTFSLAEPTVSTQAAATAMTPGDLDTNGSVVGGNDTIVIATTSDFDSETINWSDDGSAVDCTTAKCTAATTGQSGPGANCTRGTALTAAGAFTYNVPLGATSLTINAIACGTKQVASAARSVTLTVETSKPVITNSADGSHGNLTWENTFNAVVTTTTPNATICYNLNGGTPKCTAGACDTTDPNTHSVPAANPSTVTIPITTTGTGLVAVACTPTLASNGSAAANYTLNVSPYTIASDALCPATFTITPTTGTIGGPTPGSTPGTDPATGAVLCYSTTASFSYCNVAGNEPMGVTCVSYGTTPVVPTMSSSGNIWITTCRTGFNGDMGSVHAATVTGDTVSGITVNGTLDTGEWKTGNTLAGTGPVTGYYGTDGTTLFFAVSGYTAAAGTDVVIYLGDGAGTGGSTTGPVSLGAATPGFPGQLAIAWPSNGTPTTPATVYMWNGTAWTASNAAVTVGFSAGNFVEFSMPMSALTLTAPNTIDVAGDVVSGIGTSPTVGPIWPSGGTSHFVKDVLTACTSPTGEVQ